MTIKRAVFQQYQRLVNRAASQAGSVGVPPEGWLRTARKALGMSGAQLARRMGVTRARIAKAEQAELTGGITIKSMQAAADAMGCQFVYAVIPPETAENLIAAQAQKKASTVVGTASRHMALENQALPEEKIANEVRRLAADLARDMPSDLWDDK